jgi:membrane carboxypeptidase/penicillin-binding protein PbpC
MEHQLTKWFKSSLITLRSLLSQLSRKTIVQVVLITIVLIIVIAYPLNAQLKTLYAKQFSQATYDRNGERIALTPNDRGYYMEDIGTVPDNIKKVLIEKEDRFFYFHPGINPLSILRATFESLFLWRFGGSSTLTQQLVKNLLGNENNRTLGNKIIEAFYALALELYTPKNQILTMYANTVYLGNQMQGIKEASYYYYGRTPEALNDGQVLGLMAALNNPSVRYPGTKANRVYSAYLADKFDIATNTAQKDPSDLTAPYITKTDASFEINTMNTGCNGTCNLTIDASLTESLRQMLATNLDSAAFGGVENGSIVVIKLSHDDSPNQLLAIVGTPDPSATSQGQQYNMAIEPRPIGSTSKPFIYAKAFEKGTRPYTLVDDREYKYPIGTGFSLYPKNFDGEYRGIVTMHQALSNSLNVPTVQTLEYVGIDSFNNFLTTTLAFTPRQDISNYELGIALGGLEMDPLTLSYYFTIFPNNGILKPLQITTTPNTQYLQPPMAGSLAAPKRVIDAQYVKLVNSILIDRATGVDQFGLKSNLNLTQSNYAVKTGTSYNYHDSWTVGYTPDFLVGVWVGNSSNQPIREITGQQGAGKVWHDAMEILFASPYNQNSQFDLSGLQPLEASGTLEYGLPGDDYAAVRNLTLDNNLILEPHDGDVFVAESGTTIPLTAREDATWYVDGIDVAESSSTVWNPTIGKHHITAQAAQGQKESLTITITAP